MQGYRLQLRRKRNSLLVKRKLAFVLAVCLSPVVASFPQSDGGTISIRITLRYVAVTVSAPADQSGDPGQTLTYTFNIQNTGNSQDTFNLAATSSKSWALSLPTAVGPVAAGATASANVDITIPEKAKPGTQDVLTLTATSQADNTVNDSACVTMTVAVETNNPPILDAVADQTVNEGEVLSIALTASDPDGDTLTFRVVDKPPRSNLQQTNGSAVFTFSPNYNHSGTYTVTFAVTDRGRPRLSDFEIITITVIDVERKSPGKGSSDETGAEESN